MTTLERNPQAVSDEETSQIWGHAADCEEFLSRLRERGAHKLESIRSLRMLGKMSLGEAKEAVHFSSAWADRRASDDEFHDLLIHACHEMTESEDPQRMAN